MTPTVDTPAGRDPRPPGKLPPELAACPEYEVLRELGRGGMGVVYLARNRLMSRLEALKIMTGTQRVELFLREIQAAGRLAHPNVAAAYSAVKVGGGLVLAMEYVEGRDLQRQVDARGPLSVAYACECVRQAALGLQHAFDRGIVHRDIKPGNLIATRTASAVVVKLLDFGVAGVVGEGAEELPLGTPAFAAPEQVLDPALADARSDIYALGGTLYFLLTGEHPFAAETSTEVIRRHRHEPPRELAAARPDVPPALAAVVARMLAKDPADRFRSATEVAAALAPFADPQAPPFSGTRPPAAAAPDSVAAFAATVVNRDVPVPRRRRGRVLVAAVLLAALVAIVGMVRWPGPARDPDSVPPPAVPEFVSVFDGQTLSGWVVDGPDGVDAAEWRVEDGAITTTATRNGPRTWLLTEREYGDCRVRFEYRLERGANTGLAFRAVPGERPILVPGKGPRPSPYHLQVEIVDDTDREAKFPTGQIHGGGTAGGPAIKPIKAPPPPPGEWNAMEVEFRGQGVRVVINGDELLSANLDNLINAGSQYPGLRRANGRLGFQQQARTAWFRNVAVQDLSERK